MRKRPERRTALTSQLCTIHSLKLGGSAAMTWGALIVAVGVTAVGDVLTAGLWFGPMYLLVICAAAWMLGAGHAIGLGFACLGLTFFINEFELHSFGAASQPADMLLRMSFVTVVIGLVTAARELYLREWRFARTDLLTGAMNRQAFFEVVSRAPPSPFWTMIAFADLDGLKQINDVCGHEEGDAALRSFAGAVRRSIRQTDLFARIGGDEFVICMEVKDEAAAKATAARLHQAMNRGVGGRTVSARCSLGVAILPPGFSRGADRVKMADRLMYEAKQKGAALVAATMTDPHNCTAVVRHAELTAAAASSPAVAARPAVTEAA